MTAVDRLAELDAAASPGEWRAERGELFNSVRSMAQFEDYFNEPDEANAKLAALSHLLLPAYRALECEVQHWCSTDYAEFGEQKQVPPSCLDEYKEDRRRTDMCARCECVKALEEALDM